VFDAQKEIIYSAYSFAYISGKLYVVVEYCSYGSVEGYIRCHREDFDNTDCTTNFLISRYILKYLSLFTKKLNFFLTEDTWDVREFYS
jgi:hypothetical protein